jgi:type IV secretory pathway TraG/TraD family ATPase VirD4
MMVTKFQMDAMSRADIAEKDRVDFYLYVDEFQNFATDSFATILSEARKYKLNLVMANQYIDQMQESVR